MSNPKIPKILHQVSTKNCERQSRQAMTKVSQKLRKEFTTVMIGALSIFEEIFGEMWEHGTPVSELSDEALLFFQKWQLARHQILDLGNERLRAAISDITVRLHDLARYNTLFVPVQQDKEK